MAGDFTRWQEWPIPLRPQRGGRWKASVELEPGTHRYRFIVDGHWCDDPESELYTTNADGGRDAVRQVT